MLGQGGRVARYRCPAPRMLGPWQHSEIRQTVLVHQQHCRCSVERFLAVNVVSLYNSE